MLEKELTTFFLILSSFLFFLSRLILAANRDEFFHRPAKAADFNGEVLSGESALPFLMSV